jgi:hypothetical protein
MNIKIIFNVKWLHKVVYLNDFKRHLKLIRINPYKIIIFNRIHNNLQYIGIINLLDDKSEIMISILGNKETILI